MRGAPGTSLATGWLLRTVIMKNNGKRIFAFEEGRTWRGELFQHFYVAPRHAPEIGRIRGQHRKAVVNCGGTDDQVKSSERYASPERAHEMRVDARDFKVERQRAK